MSNLPPNLTGTVKEVVVSGSHPAHSEDWLPIESIKLYTNAFIWNDQTGKILLGYKKRGFGVGLFNGFGGKVEPGETSIDAAVRELKEEAGIDAVLIPCGTLLFYEKNQPWAHLVEVFYSNQYEGTITESEEMRPEWFSLPPELYTNTHRNDPPFPFGQMWSDVRLWLPLMITRRKFIGRVDFAKITEESKNADRVKWWIATVD
ncbi:NUDIX hydrolase domain-like protein [Hysterangium stoloniferum]|nr:NUDIX hydrolase domain-like protein [Hysterangium stoloniferum]